MMSGRILIADDDREIRLLLRQALLSEPWRVRIAGDGREALRLLFNIPFDVAVLDVFMPHLSGLEVLEAVQQKEIQTDVVLLTGFGTIELAVQAMKQGAQDFLAKPIDLHDFAHTIRRLIGQRNPSSHSLAARLDVYLAAQVSNASLRLSDLCAHFRISPRYASRLFRDYIGASFRERRVHHRLQKARQMLETTDDPLYIIAEQCGFRNPRRFSEVFHKNEAVTPRAFRQICADRRKLCR